MKMTIKNSNLFMFMCLLLHLFLPIYSGSSELQVGYYSKSCPRAEKIIKEEVTKFYDKQYHTATSWLRNLFHDCIVKSCDASLLLDTANGIQSEKLSNRNLGMRNFRYIDRIKATLEKECPMTVSCADIIALSAREAVTLFGGPYIQMKTGRRDSRISYLAEVDSSTPNHNDSMSSVLSTFQAIGVNTEGLVALLGGHSVGRVHCYNLVHRLYPTVDPTLDPKHAAYLKKRCPSHDFNTSDKRYSRNDLNTPKLLDNMYYKHILAHEGLLIVDQELASDSRTRPFVMQMAADNEYFHAQFKRAMLILSEHNPLTGNEGEIRRDCRYVN